MFIASHWSLSWARWIQRTTSHIAFNTSLYIIPIYSSVYHLVSFYPIFLPIFSTYISYAYYTPTPSFFTCLTTLNYVSSKHCVDPPYVIFSILPTYPHSYPTGTHAKPKTFQYHSFCWARCNGGGTWLRMWPPDPQVHITLQGILLAPLD
jgi:hypothetical protein